MKGHEILLQERYVLDDAAPRNSALYGPDRHYGVRDRTLNRWAMLPNATQCWGLTLSEAGDALVELRGGPMARDLRSEAS